ncbi:hypothetical protein [Saccharopolyspora taberi]|uniref:Uncharacterized protein n=1 Tax=Saccharopolyspora taberi TaxID=60895 RepID=A0ABN3VAW0_9PSEU
MVEAIAEGFKLDAHGGRAGRKYANDRPKTLFRYLADPSLYLRHMTE